MRGGRRRPIEPVEVVAIDVTVEPLVVPRGAAYVRGPDIDARCHDIELWSMVATPASSLGNCDATIELIGRSNRDNLGQAGWVVD